MLKIISWFNEEIKVPEEFEVFLIVVAFFMVPISFVLIFLN